MQKIPYLTRLFIYLFFDIFKLQIKSHQVIFVALLYFTLLYSCSQVDGLFPFLCIRDPKDLVVIRVSQEKLEKEVRRDTEDSPVCRVCLDLL